MKSLNKFQPTDILNTYWKFAFERQNVFLKRILKREQKTLTTDPIISKYKFTNVYRASDRVSQYLIKNVIYEASQNYEEVFFRTLLFKIFNRIETWEHLVSSLKGIPSWKSFKFETYDKILTSIQSTKPIYSQAYMMPSPNFKQKKKHQNHLVLIQELMRNKVPTQIIKTKSLQEVYSVLRKQDSFGDFLAFQYTIDLNYSDIIDFDENDFVVAGVGAIRGIHKCFSNVNKKDYTAVIYKVTECADDEFKRLGLNFKKLFGRSLKPIDCQNIFCETDKYSRVAHPKIKSNRTKIKQKFIIKNKALPQWYPPKWKLNIPEPLVH